MTGTHKLLRESPKGEVEDFVSKLGLVSKLSYIPLPVVPVRDAECVYTTLSYMIL